MDDVRERLSEFDRALADALDLDVSPDFVARVRRRIAQQPRPAPVWRAWRIALPVAAAVIVVIAVGALVLTRTPAAPTLLLARTLRLELPGPAEGRAAGPSLRPIAPTRLVPRVDRTAAAMAAGPRVPAEAGVLVPAAEIEMYRRLIAAAQTVNGPALVEVWMRAPAELPMSAIQIEPIRIDLIVPPVSGEGDRPW